MFILLAVLLAAATFLIVAYPILARSRAPEPAVTSAQERLNGLLAQRDAAFQALRELNFDHQVGKITAEDFVVFEAYLKQVAAEALRALDEWEKEVDRSTGQVLEREVAARKATLSHGRQSCPACGSPAGLGDRFCAVCGANLAVTPITATAEPVAALCSHCGRSFKTGDRFCAGCGRPL
jgi:hypothetical protein